MRFKRKELKERNEMEMKVIESMEWRRLVEMNKSKEIRIERIFKWIGDFMKRMDEIGESLRNGVKKIERRRIRKKKSMEFEMGNEINERKKDVCLIKEGGWNLKEKDFGEDIVVVVSGGN